MIVRHYKDIFGLHHWSSNCSSRLPYSAMHLPKTQGELSARTMGHALVSRLSVGTKGLWMLVVIIQQSSHPTGLKGVLSKQNSNRLFRNQDSPMISRIRGTSFGQNKLSP